MLTKQEEIWIPTFILREESTGQDYSAPDSVYAIETTPVSRLYTTPPGFQLYQEAITIVAKMWPPEENGTATPGGFTSGSGGGWLLGEDRLPLVIGALTGGSLLLLVLLAVALWRCYHITSESKHSYCMKEAQDIMPSQCHTNDLTGRHDSAICIAGPEGQWAYTSHLLMPAVSAPHWFYNSRVIGTLERLDPSVPRSISVPQPATWTTCLDHSCHINGGKQRPLSQPAVRFMPCEMSLYSTYQFTSSSALEGESMSRSRSASAPSGTGVEESLRTRSLPAWIRSRSRPYPPLSSAEDLTQLYTQANLSKKRRNRMRHGEAAIIALSRSRSRCHLLPTTQQPVLTLTTNACVNSNKDTESLVDHEAVLVYDERTAV